MARTKQGPRIVNEEQESIYFETICRAAEKKLDLERIIILTVKNNKQIGIHSNMDFDETMASMKIITDATLEENGLKDRES